MENWRKSAEKNSIAIHRYLTGVSNIMTSTLVPGFADVGKVKENTVKALK